MYEVKILHTGYSEENADKTQMTANGTSSLITRPGGKHIVVDTMTSWDGSFLRQKLAEEKLSCDDIHFVVNTHGHSDHTGSNHLFLKARHIVGQSISEGTTYFLESFPYVIDDGVTVIETPGHTLDSVSVLVNTENGTVAIVGDLFEREEDIFDKTLWKEIAGSEDPKQQEQHRQNIIRKADFIVPGHGPMFKVTDEHKRTLKAE